LASIARRYAQALLEALKTPEEIERAQNDLAGLRKVLSGVSTMARLLSHPGIEQRKKKALLDSVFVGLDCLPAVRRLTSILVDKRRLVNLPAIEEAYRRLKDRRLGMTSVEVTMTIAATEDQKAAWDTSLKKLTGGPVRIDYRTDTSLIGGAMARIGSVVYDGSVRGSLERIRQSLLGE